MYSIIRKYYEQLYVKQEVHDVTILDSVFLTLCRKLSCGPYGCFGLVVDKILVFDDFGPYKAFFEVGMDDTGRLRSLVALVDGPCPAFVSTCREECLQAEQFVCALDQSCGSGFSKPHFIQEHLSSAVHCCLMRHGTS